MQDPAIVTDWIKGRGVEIWTRFRALGSARLTALHFRNAVVKIELSWPTLAKAPGRQVSDPSRWAGLYLRSANAAELDTSSEIVALTRKGEIAEHQRAILSDIEGVVSLDGTLSQDKALRWRHARMLKCQRVILNPAHPRHRRSGDCDRRCRMRHSALPRHSTWHWAGVRRGDLSSGVRGRLRGETATC